MWNHRVLESTLAEDHYFTFTDNGNKKNYDNNQMEQLVLVAQVTQKLTVASCFHHLRLSPTSLASPRLSTKAAKSRT